MASVERDVTYCTAATSKLTPLIARGDHLALSNAAIDGRNRCSTARAHISDLARKTNLLDGCVDDVSAQQRVSVAQLALLDAYTIERRDAVIQALNDAIVHQLDCAKAVATLRNSE